MAVNDRPCPRCTSLLVERDGPSHRLLVCRTCGGLFARGIHPEGVPSALHEQHVVAEAKAAAQAMLISDDSALVRCPECSAGLERYRLDGTTVEIDACGTHGVWFDRDELPKLAGSLRPGSNPKAILIAAGSVAAGAAAVAAVQAASAPAVQASMAGNAALAVGEVVVEGVVGAGFDVVGDLISGIFS